MRSAPVTIAPTFPVFKKCPTMLSVMSVSGMPPLCNSQAVRRAPWRYGRVSGTRTWSFRPCSNATRITPSGGKRSGVALCHHLTFARHEFRAESPDGLIRRRFFEMDLLRFFDHPLLDSRHVRSLCRKLGEPPLHALERPEQIHRRGTCLRKNIANLAEFASKRVHRFGRRMQHSQPSAHRRRDADRRRAANNHLANRFRDFAVVGAGVGNLLSRKPPLVQHHHAAVCPFNGLSYVHFVSGPAEINSAWPSGIIHCNGREARKTNSHGRGGRDVNP